MRPGKSGFCPPEAALLAAGMSNLSLVLAPDAVGANGVAVAGADAEAAAVERACARALSRVDGSTSLISILNALSSTSISNLRFKRRSAVWYSSTSRRSSAIVHGFGGRNTCTGAEPVASDPTACE